MTKAVKAKKHLGQHFLNNDEIALKITDLLSKKQSGFRNWTWNGYSN